MGDVCMYLLKKKKNVVSSLIKKKAQKPLEYERFIKVKCPYCSKGTDRKKQVFIEMPSEKMPNTIRCYVCDNVINTKDIFETGIEIKRR